MSFLTTETFTELYDAHYSDVLRFVRRRAHPLVVDDIVGETFLAAWRRRTELPADPRPWLFGTARNAMLNVSRGARRQIILSAAIGAEPFFATDDFADVEHRIDLKAAWNRLSPDDQELLALHIWEDISPKDGAAILGVSRAAYSMRLTRAKRHLAQLMGRAGDHPRLVTVNEVTAQ